MDLDIEDDALTCSSYRACGPGSKKRKTKSWFLDGPGDLAGILSVNAAGANRLVKHARLQGDTGLIERISEFVTRPAVITSTFTGYGTFEDMFRDVRQLLADELELQPGKLVW